MAFFFPQNFVFMYCTRTFPHELGPHLIKVKVKFFCMFTWFTFYFINLILNLWPLILFLIKKIFEYSRQRSLKFNFIAVGSITQVICFKNTLDWNIFIMEIKLVVLISIIYLIAFFPFFPLYVCLHVLSVFFTFWQLF